MSQDAQDIFGEQTTIFKWDKTALTFSPVKDIKYSRSGYANLGTPITTDIEKWCIPESNITTTKAPQIDVKELEILNDPVKII